MNFLIRFVIFCMDPLGLGRRFFIRPALKVGLHLYDHLKVITANVHKKADEKVITLKEVVLRLGLVAFAVALIVWTAIFLYATFYFTYMPSISHTKPVHMQFKTCLDSSTPCSFPYAHVSLTQRQQILMVGQAYRVIVNIEMPESPQNLDLGLFMVCAEMRDIESMLRGHSCRSAMMRYRSPLIRTITTWALSPLYVLGWKEEFQRVPVEIFSRYLEQQQHPITDVYVEIQSQKIQFYTVSLHIVADFTGLRYIMHNWPVFSAVVGISTNLFFLLIIFLLSWYHWSDTTWLRSIQEKYVQFTNTVQSTASRVLEKSSTGLHDDEELSFLDEKTTGSEIEDISGASSGSARSSSIEDLSRQRSDEEEETRARLRHRRPQETKLKDEF